MGLDINKKELADQIRATREIWGFKNEATKKRQNFQWNFRLKSRPDKPKTVRLGDGANDQTECLLLFYLFLLTQLQ